VSPVVEISEEMRVLYNGAHGRSGLEPPLLQQAAFDDDVYEVDVMRNVAAKHTLAEHNRIERDRDAHRCPSLSVSRSRPEIFSYFFSV